MPSSTAGADTDARTRARMDGRCRAGSDRGNSVSEQKTLTTDERCAILDKAVQRYVKQGFRVVSRTDTTAQLVKPKSFGCLWILLALLTLGLALWIPLETLARGTSYLVLVVFALANAALLLIKRTQATPEGIINNPRWVPAIGLISSLGLVFFQLVSG